MFERFSRPARVAVILAQEEARELIAGAIGPEHLLVGVLKGAPHGVSEVLGGYGLTADVVRARLAADGGGMLDDEALRSIGIDLQAVRDSIAGNFGAEAFDDAFRTSGRRRRGHIPFTRSAKKALELSLREALAHKDKVIRLEHVVLGIVRGGDPVVIGLITEHVSASQLREAIDELLNEAA